MTAMLAKICRAAKRSFAPGVAGVAAALSVAHFVWKSSGSNEWELKRDESGVQVFTLKSPGSSLLKVKATMRVATSLSSAVFLLRGDPSTSGDLGGTDFKVIERMETPSVFLAFYSLKHKMPAPLRDRQLVVLLNYAQDKVSKRVEINVQAAPTRIPPTENTSRVTHLNNIFRLTPLPNGEIEWQVIADVDMGLLYPFANLVMPDYFFEDLSYHRKLVRTEKYRGAKLASVQEL